LSIIDFTKINRVLEKTKIFNNTWQKK